MKNTAIFLLVVLALWYFVKEGKKNDVAGSENKSIADDLKTGIESTFNKLTGKKDQAVSDKTTVPGYVWEPSYLGEKPPIEMMTSYVAPDPFSGFHKTTSRRGSFLHPSITAFHHNVN